jgi:hypothetical protein
MQFYLREFTDKFVTLNVNCLNLLNNEPLH